MKLHARGITSSDRSPTRFNICGHIFKLRSALTTRSQVKEVYSGSKVLNLGRVRPPKDDIKEEAHRL